MGASQQDIDHIEEEIMFQGQSHGGQKDSYGFTRKSRVSGHEANKQNKQRSPSDYDEEDPEEIQTIRDDKKSGGRQVRGSSGSHNRRDQNVPMEHMVDSYEIYGENQPDESNESDYNMKQHQKIEEEILKPNQMMKSDKRMSGTSKGRKMSNQGGSGAKNTQIEILDHETPIEEYQH